MEEMKDRASEPIEEEGGKGRRAQGGDRRDWLRRSEGVRPRWDGLVGLFIPVCLVDFGGGVGMWRFRDAFGVWARCCWGGG